MNHTQLYPRLFVGERLICICYWDDLILWSLNESEINDISIIIISAGVNLEEEFNAAGFLSVRIDRDGDTGMLELKKTDLTDKIIEYLGLYVGTAKLKFTPAETTQFVND